MKPTLLAGAAAVVVCLAPLALAPPATAQSGGERPAAKRNATDGGEPRDTRSACMVQLEETRRKLQEDERFRKLHSDRAFGVTGYSDLIDAARVLDRRGMDRQCRQVVRALDDFARNRLAAARDRGAADDRPLVEADPQRIAPRLQGAVPVTEGSFGIQALLSANVHDPNNQPVGSVADLVAEQGEVGWVIVGSGGFLGIGETHHRVPFDRFRAINDDVPFLVLDLGDRGLSAFERVEKRDGVWRVVGG